MRRERWWLRRWYIRVGWGLVAFAAVGWPWMQANDGHRVPAGVIAVAWFSVLLNAARILLDAYLTPNDQPPPDPPRG
jgi:hypothetical protein